MEYLKQQIQHYLKTEFENTLFEATLNNLRDTNNPLRLNNFAFSARELTRHFLDRLAPDEEVRKAPWFQLYDSDKPNMVTREQKIKYAIQGYISDEYRKNVLLVDLEDISKNLRHSIDELSKYTHVGPKTFNVSDSVVDDVSLTILTDILEFFETIRTAQLRVQKAIYDCIDEEMVSKFYIETHNELDMLATHHEVLGYFVTSIEPKSKDESTITMQASGSVLVRLQYGSDGDMRRGDGYETEESFPFTSEFVVDYKNHEGDIHIESADVDIDNSSFWE